MKLAINKIFEQIVFHSTSGPEFEIFPKYKKNTKELAFTLKKTQFKLIRKNVIVYTGTKNKHKLLLNDARFHSRCSCDCKYFITHGIRMHLVGYSNLFELNLFDIRYSKPIKPTNFVHKIKRSRIGGRLKKMEKHWSEIE